MKFSSNLPDKKHALNMSHRSYIVSTQGSMERMPTPILAEPNRGKIERMKIVIPASTQSTFQARLKTNGKYIQNNTANSLNIRDYTEYHVKSSERSSKTLGDENRHSYSLKQWSH